MAHIVLLLAALASIITTAPGQSLTAIPVAKGTGKGSSTLHQAPPHPAAALLAQASAAAAAAPQPGVRLSLVFSRTTLGQLRDQDLHRRQQQRESHGLAKRRKKAAAPASVVLPLLRDINLFVTTGLAAVGTPFQGPFQVILDTGSSDPWVLGFVPQDGVGIVPFVPSKSKTFQDYGYKVNLTYGSESDIVRVARDQFALVAETASGKLQPAFPGRLFDFGVSVKRVSQVTPYNGIVGFAWPGLDSLSSPFNLPLPYVLCLLNGYPGFSFWYNTSAQPTAEPGTYAPGAGFAILGQPDPSLYIGFALEIKINLTPLGTGYAYGFWEAGLLHGGPAGGKHVKASGYWPAIFDTGTTTLVVRTEVYQAYLKAVFKVAPAAKLVTEANNILIIPTSQLGRVPPLVVAVGDGTRAIEFNLPARSLVLVDGFTIPDTGDLQYSILGLQGDDQLSIFGFTFLRNFYTVWSYAQASISFAARADL